MAKDIILFSDGTGNSAAKFNKTNVWRLYQTLDLSAPAAGQRQQIAYYDDGVGTSSFKPLALLGGAFGWGLRRNVIDLYCFLCRNYHPDDRIYAFGFSRGAYTIRVLIGLIANQGLVRADTEEKLRELAVGAFHAYRHENYRRPLDLERRIHALGEILSQAGTRAPDQPLEQQAAAPKGEMGPEIAFLGLWDTVAAYGLPFQELTRAWDWVFPLWAPNRELSPKVLRACHALALDDERKTFHPVLWNERDLELQPHHASRIRDERLSQVWFAGMHSNVGGGYPDDALSCQPLDWIMGEAEHAGLRFKTGARSEIQAAINVSGKLYDSRRGFGGFYRYQPRKLSVLTQDTGDPKNTVIIERPKIHESVFERIRIGADSYAPIALPAHYAVVTAQGDIVDQPPVPNPGNPCLIEHQTQAEDRANRQEQVWNLVWWKRGVYIASVFMATLLALFPFFLPATAACEESLCALSPVVRGIGRLLPDFLNPWLNAYESHPAAFFILALLLAALLYAGGRLQTRIFDDMHAIWKPIVDALGHPVARVAGLPQDAVYRLRSREDYRHFFKRMRDHVFPAIAGLLAVFVIFAAISQALFSMMDSAGWVCTPSPAGHTPDPSFSSDAVCWASGVRLRKGQRYAITLAIADGESWKDWTIPSGIGGYGPESMTPILYPAVLLRRHAMEPWFQPVARIGSQGTDEYPLRPADGSATGETTRELRAELTARRDGELFLFVNDAVLPVPGALQFFYWNNHGKATVTVRPVSAPGG